MTTLAQTQNDAPAARRPTSDAAVIYALFAITLVLLACSAITGWRVAHGPVPALLHVEAATPLPAKA